MLENTEGAIKNGQSRETVKTKENKRKNTTNSIYILMEDYTLHQRFRLIDCLVE